MSTNSEPLNALTEPPIQVVAAAPASADRGMAELQALLKELETAASAGQTLPPVFGEAVDDQLVRIRLGAAASLFAALRCKNAAVARHALGVALSCSAWAVKMNLPETQRHAVEVAALLHDIGDIGVPDRILLKSGSLDANEAAVMHRSGKMGADILRCGSASPVVVEIVENVATWYDGSTSGGMPKGQRIPLGARMIAIVEAFDAMTTDLVYRPARSQERALAELFDGAGSQFDPELVEQFAGFHREDQTALRWEVAHRWLRRLESNQTDLFGEMSYGAAPAIEPDVDSLFEGRLLDNMYDAVVFVDAAGRVQLWNRGAERLTGIAGVGVRGQPWHAELLGLSDEQGRPIGESDCPVQTAIRCGAQSLRRLTILGRAEQPVSVDAHAIPVIDPRGVCQGAILLFHDASSEISLEQRCQHLHEKASKDPLTQVANRAEFDRVHAMFVAAHRQQQVPCSLLMCDLDRFKQVNDTYGHQAGDEVIQCLASLMKSSCRPGDLVARYGGEEFVMLCADCDNAAAARRAEQIREELSQIPMKKMEGRRVTVSFGVTEVQPGDTPETMLRRADRALLMAKAKGRNNVVQLGQGGVEAAAPAPVASRFLQALRSKEILHQDLVTPVPIKIAVEKLRGFVADHQAKIAAIDGNHVRLEIEERPASRLRRLTDRPVVFWIDAIFEEERLRKYDSDEVTTRTRISVTISPRRGRDRRRANATDRAREVMRSFRSYLMATQDESTPVVGALTRAKKMLAPWLLK